MLDLKFIRLEPNLVKEKLERRGLDGYTIDSILKLDEQRRKILFDVTSLKEERNKVSDEIGRLKKEKKDAQDKILAMREVSAKIKEIDSEIKTIEEKIQKSLLEIPNMVDDSVPVGPDEESNIEIRKWGEPRDFDFEPQAHWDLGERLNILDFERGAKIAAARFTVLKNIGACLERALTNFMLDIHTREHGYQEIFPPFLVNATTMTGTGQLPKFENDLFKSNLYIILLILPVSEGKLGHMGRMLEV